MEKISIGVCVLRKDLPVGLEEILARVQMFDEFTVSYLKDEAILEKEIFGWPIFDCLIAFGSGEFPLQKVKSYAAIRQPFLVNELEEQHLLHDRSMVYELLAVSTNCQDHGMKIKYAFFNRKGPRQELDYYIEEKHFILVHGNQLRELFVEKPDHGDDHSKMICNPCSVHGDLFLRKISEGLNEFRAAPPTVRREGSYIYEEFEPTGGTLVKVYTVGPEYAHAEARNLLLMVLV